MTNIEYVIDKISNTELKTDPCEHLEIRNFLPSDLYQELKSYVSSLNFVNKIKPTERHSYSLVHQSRNLIDDDSAVREYYSIMWNQSIIDLLKSKFTMENSYTNDNGNQEVIDFDIAYDVVRRPFKYKVHSDVKQKLFTCIHYFADEGDDENLGTGMAPSTHPYPVYDLENVTDKKTAKYIPNNLFIFSPSGHPKGTPGYTDGGPRKDLNVNTPKTTNHYYENLSDTTEFRKTCHIHYLLEKVSTEWCGPEHFNYKHLKKI